MAADSTEIVLGLEQAEERFSELTQLVTGPATATATAAETELRLFRELLRLGRLLLQVPQCQDR
jgi:hypothetical protein